MSDKSSLLDLIAEYAFPSILEIGVAQGENALRMLSEFPNMKYLGIDEWRRRSDMEHEDAKLRNWHSQQKWDEVYQRVKDSMPPNASIIRANSHEVLPFIYGPAFSVVIIDGDHSQDGCYQDIVDASKLIFPNGAIWIDDLQYDSVRNAVAEFLRRNQGFKQEGNIIR